MNAPLVIFAYNRPRHLQTLLQSLQACPEYAQSPVTIYCDGPRKPEDLPAIDATRTTARQFALPHANIIERAENFGLAKSIITGVTDACAQHGRVIVLEDDLELSPQALTYFNAALDRYADDARVMHISGYTQPVKKDGLPPMFFHQEATCSGWATWARAWAHFQPDAQQLQQHILADKKTAKRFNIDDGAGYADMLRAQILGRVNSWAIRWYASMFLRGGLTLFSRQPFIRNNGHDGSGVHSQNTTAFDVALPTQKQDFLWPPEVVQNPLAMARHRAFWLKHMPPLTFWRRAKGKIRRTLKSWLARA